MERPSSSPSSQTSPARPGRASNPERVYRWHLLPPGSEELASLWLSACAGAACFLCWRGSVPVNKTHLHNDCTSPWTVLQKHKVKWDHIDMHVVLATPYTRQTLHDTKQIFWLKDFEISFQFPQFPQFVPKMLNHLKYSHSFIRHSSLSWCLLCCCSQVHPATSHCAVRWQAHSPAPLD